MAIIEHLEKLPHFVAVAETGSFRKASTRLRIAQPSLSKSVALLEQACGAQLLHRQQRGTTLTPEGEVFLIAAREILRTATRIHGRLVTATAQGKCQWRIVTHEPLVPLIAKTVADLASASHNLHVQTSMSVQQLLGWIEDFVADIGVVASASPLQASGLHGETLYEDAYEFFCSSAFRALHLPPPSGPPLTLADLRRFPLILAPQVLAGPDESLAAHLARRGIDLQPRHTVGSIESVATLAHAGLGIALLPEKTSQFFGGGKFLEKIAVRLPGNTPLGRHLFTFCCRTDTWERDEFVPRLFAHLRAAACRGPF